MRSRNIRNGQARQFGAQPPTRGSVLILTLWTLFFLAALALAIGGHVSADLRLAEGLGQQVTATMLARAGAERAALAVLRNPTNWNGTADAELRNDPAVFRDNDSLEGGTFSVYYLYVDSGTGLVATNYGIVREDRKVNINRGVSERERLVALGVPPDVADNILLWPGRKKKSLAERGRNGYPALYESVHELLLVDGVTEELYSRLVSHVTLYRGDTYGGVSEGRVRPSHSGQAGGVSASRRVAFVFDRRKAGFVYWHEF